MYSPDRNSNTVKPLYSGHLRDRNIVSAIWRCPLYRGSVWTPENFLIMAFFRFYVTNRATIDNRQWVMNTLSAPTRSRQHFQLEIRVEQYKLLKLTYLSYIVSSIGKWRKITWKLIDVCRVPWLNLIFRHVIRRTVWRVKICFFSNLYTRNFSRPLYRGEMVLILQKSVRYREVSAI